MRTLGRAVATFLAAIVVLGAALAPAQEFPNKPIRIVTSEATSGSDFVVRLIGQGLTGRLGQPVIIDNRGGIGIIPAQLVAQAPADGYTLLLFSHALWLLPFMDDKVPYDPIRDFAPITLVNKTANILVVHPSLPVKSVKELIALAKAKPGALNYASGPTGSSAHLAGELFKSMAGVAIVRVPYKGSAPALTALIADQVQLMFPTVVSGLPHVKAGNLRALAVTSAQPSALNPDLPTVAASGLAGYESVSVLGMFAPAKTPGGLVRRLNQEVVRVLNQADVKAKLFNSGMEMVGSSPEQFAASIKADMARIGKVIKDVGIRTD